MDFQIANNGATVNVVHTGGQPAAVPGRTFRSCSRVTGTATIFASDTIMVKHSATYRQQNPTRVQQRYKLVNAVLGQNAVLLGFLACLAGIATIGTGLARRRPSACSGPGAPTPG